MRRIFTPTLIAILLIAIQLARASSQTSTGQNYDAGTAPYYLTTAHLDGTDTGADLIVSNHNSENLSILRNKGDGTFQPATNIPVGKAPTAVIAADFTGLAKRDLAVAVSSQDAVLLLLNKGNGEFQEPLKITVAQAPGSLAAADFNRDGRDDLIVASLGVNQATLLLSKDASDWDAPEKLDLGYVPFFVTIADLNNDGNPDFITCPWQRSGPTQLGIHLGNGDGTFAEPKRFYAGQNAYQVATGDFNQDGKLDLVTANNFSRGAHVLLGLGDGNFQTATNFPIGDCSSVITGDFNNDGQMDFAVTNSIEAKVIVMLGKGDGTFPNKQDFPVARGPVMLAVADFDRDGQRDLATANTTANNVTVVLGKAFNFPTQVKLPAISIP